MRKSLQVSEFLHGDQLMIAWERFTTKCSGMLNEVPEDKWLIQFKH